MTQLILILNFSVSNYLPLIRRDSVTHMHDLAVYAKLPFGRDSSPENSTIFNCILTGFTFSSVLLLFPLLMTFFIFIHGIMTNIVFFVCEKQVNNLPLVF